MKLVASITGAAAITAVVACAPAVHAAPSGHGNADELGRGGTGARRHRRREPEWFAPRCHNAPSPASPPRSTYNQYDSGYPRRPE